MKKLFITLLAACGIIGVQAQAPAPAENKADIQFIDDSHDFGNIKEGTMAEFSFRFKNTGTEPLILSDVHPSCGCTTPEWPREPIAPGATGVIKAIYNSNGRPGSFNKSITVSSNAVSGQKILTFRGFVEQTNVPADVTPSTPATIEAPKPAPLPLKAPIAKKPVAKPATVNKSATTKPTGNQNKSTTVNPAGKAALPVKKATTPATKATVPASKTAVKPKS